MKSVNASGWSDACATTFSAQPLSLLSLTRAREARLDVPLASLKDLTVILHIQC